MSVLERVPYAPLIAVALLMALLPFGSSHLLEKSRMLLAGTLKRPIDWFDFVLHSAPLLLLAAKFAVHLVRGSR